MICCLPGEEVAIKVLESIHEMIEEIEEEYQVLRDLSEHPNMPRFYGMFLKPNNSFDDQIWLVMEVKCVLCCIVLCYVALCFVALCCAVLCSVLGNLSTHQHFYEVNKTESTNENTQMDN